MAKHPKKTDDSTDEKESRLLLSLPTDGMKKKAKKYYVTPCFYCGHPFLTIRERCPECLNYRPIDVKPTDLAKGTSADQTILLSDVQDENIARIRTDFCDPLFGPAHSLGIAETSVNLLGGERGAGKSTLSLQLADRVVPKLPKNRDVLYVCGEQSAQELRAFAKRVGVKNLHRIRIYPLGADSDLSKIILGYKPGIIFVDSLQGLIPDMNVAKDFAEGIKLFCVEIKAPAILISQINKEGDLTGVESLQHVVDMVGTLFTTGNGDERILSNSKNRFGPSNIELYSEMTERGFSKFEERGEDNEEDEEDENEEDRD